MYILDELILPSLSLSTNDKYIPYTIFLYKIKIFQFIYVFIDMFIWETRYIHMFIYLYNSFRIFLVMSVPAMNTFPIQVEYIFDMLNELPTVVLQIIFVWSRSDRRVDELFYQNDYSKKNLFPSN